MAEFFLVCGETGGSAREIGKIMANHMQIPILIWDEEDKFFGIEPDYKTDRKLFARLLVRVSEMAERGESFVCVIEQGDEERRNLFLDFLDGYECHLVYAIDENSRNSILSNDDAAASDFFARDDFMLWAAGDEDYWDDEDEDDGFFYFEDSRWASMRIVTAQNGHLIPLYLYFPSIES